MTFSHEELLQEIENESKALSEELTLYSEADEIKKIEEKPSSGNDEKKPAIENQEDSTKNKLLKRSNVLVNYMKKRTKDEDYLVNGYGYHSKILYKLCTKFPLIGNTIGIPLVAIAKAITNNAITRKIDQEKMLSVYTTFKGDKAVVDAKISQLEKLQKPSNDQKQQIATLKKMSAELDFNIKRVEYNFKLSHIEGMKENRKRSKRAIY